MKRQTLWTYDFTVITIGSFISLVGSILSSFAVSLLVLDYTGSIFLYMFYNVAYQLPMLICPLVAGPYLDRVSRKKVIYSLDFLSAGIYLLLFLMLREGWFSYPILLAANAFTGGISSVYGVAYDSFYPNLISQGNFQKAYSISSLLEEAAFMTYPLAAILYQRLGGAAALFIIDAVSFFLAACFEVTVRHREAHIGKTPQKNMRNTAKQFRRELRDGMDYVIEEKGLLMITLYFMVLSMTSGAEQLHLPYFLNHANRFTSWTVTAATLYAILSNFIVAGRFLGGLVQYRVHIPKEKKFDVALTVYVATSLLAGTVLFLPVPLMAAFFFLNGVLGVTSYTIRTAGTQSYVPDSKRGRFNGIFQMTSALGGIAGSLLTGVLGEFLPERGIIAGANLLALGAVYLFIWRGREDVKKIYNRDV